MESLLEYADYAFEVAKQMEAEQIEAFGVKAKYSMMSVERRRISTSTNLLSGLSFRVVSRKNYGFAYTTVLDEHHVKRAVQRAYYNARAKGEDEHFESLPRPMPAEELELRVDKRLAALTVEDLLKQYDDIKKLVEEKAPNVFIIGGGFGVFSLSSFLKNNLGLEDFESRNFLFCALYALTTDELPPSVGFVFSMVDSLDTFKPEDLASKLVEETLRGRKAKSINFSGKASVLLEPEAVSSLMRIFSSEVVAPNVDRGATPFPRDKLGEVVASDVLTIEDDPRNAKNVFRSSRDHEGVPTRKVTIVERGTLKEHLNNYYYALKWDTLPTGSCTRIGELSAFNPITGEPDVDSWFLSLKGAEEAPKDELLSEIREGFVIRDVMGVHMADYSSGKFSLPCFGWYVKNGEVKHPVREVVISSSIPELLLKVKAVSKEKEVKYFPTNGLYPYLLVEDVRVTAKKYPLFMRLGLAVVNLLMKLGVTKSPIA